MRALTNVERFLERLFERPTARLFHSRIQPLQIQRRIERAMETERRSEGERTVVPDRFSVHLHPDDLAPLAQTAARLAAELADGSLAFARAHHYMLADRPRVDLVSDLTVETGEIEVRATFGRATPEPVRRTTFGAGEEPDGKSTGDGPGTDTRVYDVPRLVSPSAVLRELDPDGRRRNVPIDGTLLTIGRAPDNRLVIRDRSVSRHHARIQARHGSLVLSDLSSTNGTRVNGVRIDEMVLGEGDQIQIGGTTLIVERPGPLTSVDDRARASG